MRELKVDDKVVIFDTRDGAGYKKYKQRVGIITRIERRTQMYSLRFPNGELTGCLGWRLKTVEEIENG